MSWLGVNLNDSLKNITGQLSSLGKDVLGDEYSLEGEEGEVVSKSQAKQLESYIQLQKHEIDDLRKARDDLRERLTAADLQTAQQKQQVLDLKTELESVHVKQQVWNWEDTQAKPNQQLSPSQDLQDQLWRERVSQLEKQLALLKDAHQAEISALQDHHTSRLSSNKGVEDESAEETLEPSPVMTELKEKKLECESLIARNRQLEADMEELDAEHQLVISQIMEKKGRLQEEFGAVQEEKSSLKKQVVEAKAEAQTLTESHVILTEEIQKQKLETDRLGELYEEERKKNDLLSTKSDQLEEMCRQQQTLSGELTLKVDSTLEDNLKLKDQLTVLRSCLESCGEVLGVSTDVNDESLVGRLVTQLSELKLGETARLTEFEDVSRKLDERERECRHKLAAYEVLEIEKEKLEKVNKLLKADVKLKETQISSNLKELEELKTQKNQLEVKLNCENLQENLNGKVQSLESKIVKLEEEKKTHLSEARKLASSHDVVALEDVVEVIRDALQDRDSLQQQLTSALQEVKDAQDLLETIETEKADCEKECEDLRDQLEELQRGERQQPEGAGATTRGAETTARGLPTIEEEETETSSDASCKTALQREIYYFDYSDCGKAGKELEHEDVETRTGSDGLDDATNLRDTVEDYRHRLDDLMKTNKSLNKEILAIKDSKDIIKQRLKDAELKLRNVMESKTKDPSVTLEDVDLLDELSYILEVFNLSDDLGSGVETQQQNSTESNKIKSADELGSAETRVAALESEVKKLTEENFQLNEVAGQVQLLNFQKRLMEQRLLEVEELVEERQEMVKYLEDKVETLQSHNVTTVYSDVTEDRCLELQKNLDFVRAQLIYKDDSIDLQKQTLAEIAQLFEVEKFTPDDLFKRVSEVYRNLQGTLVCLNNKVEELEREAGMKDEHSHQLTKNNENLDKILKDKDAEINSLQSLLHEKAKIIQDLDKLNTNEDILKELKSENSKLESLLESKDDQLSNLTATITSLRDANERQETEQRELKKGKDLYYQQIESLISERKQMIATLNDKHQENVSYHAELQKLSQLLSQETQRSEQEQKNLLGKLEEEKLAHNSTKEQLQATNDKFEKRRFEADENKDASVEALNKQLESWKSRGTSAEMERDQLRVASTLFNSQYETQSKELTKCKERETQLAAEVERLRRHLVKVEETYTTEALRAEEREESLRLTVGKLEDKLSNHSTLYNTASQRANVQVETLYEQVQQLTSEREDALFRLQQAEEASEQHQQSLSTLQQVLQDFRKGQERDIAEATERVRKELQLQLQTNSELSKEICNLKEQLNNKETALLATSNLHSQLESYRRQVVTLRAQVVTQDQLVKRSQDEMVAYKASYDAKVDKHLIRNLLVGYFATHSDKRLEVLHVVATVLDLSPEERVRIGLDTQGTSWISSIANFLAPPATNVRVASKVDVLDHSSLSQAFVRFLEDESSPLPQAKLLAVEMAEQTQKKADSKAKSKAQSEAKSLTQTSNPMVMDDIRRDSSPTILPAYYDPTSLDNSTLGLSNNKLLSNLLDNEQSSMDDNDNK